MCQQNCPYERYPSGACKLKSGEIIKQVPFCVLADLQSEMAELKEENNYLRSKIEQMKEED